MIKSDKSKHNICIASIKRSTMKPYDFTWTTFYEFNSTFQDVNSNLSLELSDNELIICSTVIDYNNFSILTTRRLITKENGKQDIGEIEGATGKQYGDFKGYKEKLTFGQIQLHSGVILKYFIETGKASMVMIYGVRTLLQTQEMTNSQVNKVTRIWNKQNEKQTLPD
ncbi:hypothetical protein ACI6Q2_22550 [Chitinophagaceae bacterium LWZ2-11]